MKKGLITYTYEAQSVHKFFCGQNILHIFLTSIIKHECKMQCACKDLEGGRCLRDVAVLSVPPCVLPQDGLVVLHGGICVSTIIISLILVLQVKYVCRLNWVQTSFS